MDNKLTHEEAIEQHKGLHKSLDQLTACYLYTTQKSLDSTSVMDLMEWSYQQTINPSCGGEKNLDQAEDDMDDNSDEVEEVETNVSE